MLKNDPTLADKIPAIRIMEGEAGPITIDHRRLAAFQIAGKKIRTVEATVEEIIEAARQGKFSAGPLGRLGIRIRNSSPKGVPGFGKFVPRMLDPREVPQ